MPLVLPSLFSRKERFQDRLCSGLVFGVGIAHLKGFVVVKLPLFWRGVLDY